MNTTPTHPLYLFFLVLFYDTNNQDNHSAFQVCPGLFKTDKILGFPISTKKLRSGLNIMQNILHVHLGQAGVQSGHAVWEQLCQEHGLDQQGKHEHPTAGTHSVFMENSQGRFQPRAVFIDSEPMAIDELFTSNPSSVLNSNRQLYSKNGVVAGKQSAASNFMRGSYALRDVSQKASEAIRKQSEKCDNLKGFFFTHSVNGGSGSGMGEQVMQQLSVDFSKHAKYNFTIYPSLHTSSIVTEPYNAVFSTHYLVDHSSAIFPLTNHEVYQFLHTLDIDYPTFHNANKVIAEAVCAHSAAARFPQHQMMGGFADFLTNAIPVPRMNFLATSIGSFAPADQRSFRLPEVETYDLLEQTFMPKNSLVYQGPSNKTYMSCSLFMSGHDCSIKALDKAIEKRKRSLKLVEWNPTGFKCYYNARQRGEDRSYWRGSMGMVMAANTDGVRGMLGQINHKFDVMYSRRAFVHWYMGEGLSQDIFEESRELGAVIEKDYQLLAEPMETSEQQY